jgi:hypothetical protein
MADVKQDQKKTEVSLPKRCGERVAMARISSETGAMPPFVTGAIIGPGKGGVEAMALHPWGLAVVLRGRVYVVPSGKVSMTELVAGE